MLNSPNDENKLFDVDDDVGTSTILDLLLHSEDDDEEEVKSNNVWEYAIDTFNFHNFILKENVSENGSNIKTWRLWNHFTNGMKIG